MAYLYRKDRSPFWYVVYFDADQKELMSMQPQNGCKLNTLYHFKPLHQ